MGAEPTVTNKGAYDECVLAVRSLRARSQQCHPGDGDSNVHSHWTWAHSVQYDVSNQTATASTMRIVPGVSKTSPARRPALSRS